MELHFPENGVTRILWVFFVVIFLFLGARGTVFRKPFGIADAFINNKLATGNLAINGFYSFYRTAFSKKGTFKPYFMPYSKAEEILKEMIYSERTTYTSKKYILERRFTRYLKSDRIPLHPNIVVVLLESFSAEYIDSFNKGVGVKFGVTHNFDRLAHEGLRFTNFYANGIRSLDGITSILAGFVRPMGVDYLGNGLELTKISYLPRLLKREGYHNIMMQASWRRSLRVDSISRFTGFDEYFGAEDMWCKGSEKGHPILGIWDRCMYEFIIKKLDQTKQPFFLFAFSAATHIPFYSPGKQWEKYPHSNGSVTGFLNTLYYADWAIGRFIEEARERDWFKNTNKLYP